MSLNVTFADRLTKLPPYLFAAIDEMKAQAKREGKDVINLGVGDPDLPTPPHIIATAAGNCHRSGESPVSVLHRYDGFPQKYGRYITSGHGMSNSIPRKQVLTLIGSKEGVGHIPLAFINPGDTVLIPNPGYPVYGAGTTFANGEQYLMPLLKENGFLPDLDAIPSDVASKAKLMFINYPNNPTAATCDISFFSSSCRIRKRA